MFTIGFIVLVMSTCHDKDTDGLWCIGFYGKNISSNVF